MLVLRCGCLRAGAAVEVDSMTWVAVAWTATEPSTFMQATISHWAPPWEVGHDESCVYISAADPCGAVTVLTRNWLCAGEIPVTEQNAKQAREVFAQTHYWIAREQQSWAWTMLWHTMVALQDGRIVFHVPKADLFMSLSLRGPEHSVRRFLIHAKECKCTYRPGNRLDQMRCE